MINVVIKTLIVVALFAVVFSLLWAVTTTDFTAPIYAAMQNAAPYFAALNTYIPVDTLLSVVRYLFVFESMILLFKVGKWALS